MVVPVIVTVLLAAVGTPILASAEPPFAVGPGVRPPAAASPAEVQDRMRTLTERFLGGGGPTGASPRPAGQPAAETPVAATPPPAPRVPASDLLLAGIVITADRRMALVQEPGQDGGRFVQVGETIGRYRVTAVEADRVALAGPDGAVELRLRGAGSPSSSGTVTSVPPPRGFDQESLGLAEPGRARRDRPHRSRSLEGETGAADGQGASVADRKPDRRDRAERQRMKLERERLKRERRAEKARALDPSAALQ